MYYAEGTIAGPYPYQSQYNPQGHQRARYCYWPLFTAESDAKEVEQATWAVSQTSKELTQQPGSRSPQFLFRRTMPSF